jgi:regulator of ribonuclease activity A
MKAGIIAAGHGERLHAAGITTPKPLLAIGGRPLIARAIETARLAGATEIACIVNAIADLDLGVQALGSHPLKTEKRGLGDVNVPVTFGGVTFRPGDYVYGDNNGLLVSAQKLELPQD